MRFTKRLREGVRRGEITCRLRVWMSRRGRVGGRYKMDEGAIEVDSIQMIGFPDITPELARESGFLGVLDLLKVAKHGKGNNIYLIRFHYIPPRRKRTDGRRNRIEKRGAPHRANAGCRTSRVSGENADSSKSWTLASKHLPRLQS